LNDRAERSCRTIVHFQTSSETKRGTMLSLLPVVVAVGVVGVITVACVIYTTLNKRRKRLPPYAPATMWQNIQALMMQKSMHKVTRMRKFLQDVDPKSPGASVHGNTIMLALPEPNCFIFTTDTVLARCVLFGENGIAEAPDLLPRIANFVDPDQDNILTHKTANPDRESARKAIAPAFSTSNLTRTWPDIKVVLGEQFAKFRQTAASGGIVDCKSMVLQFFLRTLSRGAYNVEFTDDGTENEGNINGLEYLQEMGVVSRESAYQFIIPFRRYMWWLKGVRRAALGNKRLGEMMGKIVRLHKQNEGEQGGEGVGKHSILDHVVGHKYKSENERLCDLAIITSASVDTTSHTLCFMLMEVSRRTEVK
jgi:hypothetical protein